MKTGIKLKALLLGFSICASVGALAGTSALLSNNTQDEISASSVYADEQGSTPEGTETAEVAEISGSTVKYAALQEAINAAQAGDTVTLLNNVDSTAQIAIDKNITLDLNGKELCSTYTPKKGQIVISAEVTIRDSSKAQTGCIKTNYTGTAGRTVELNGEGAGAKLTLESGTIYGMPATSSKSGSAVYLGGNTTFLMKGGKIKLEGKIEPEKAERNSSAVNVSGEPSSFDFEDGEIIVDDTEAYGVFAKKGDITINGGKITAPKAIYSHQSITISGGDVKGTVELSNKVSISGGTFSNYFNPTFLATGYGVISIENGYKIESGYIAQTATDSAFGKAYKTLTEAINGAESGSTVYPLSDASDFAGVTIKKDLTIDFGNYTVTGATGATCFNVESSSVTFKASGKGGVNGGSGGNNVAILAYTDSKVTIESGNYTVGGDANGQGNSTVYVMSNGKAIIKGGTFSSEAAYNGKYYVLNLHNKSTGSFQVSGGTFINFDPATGDDNLGGNFVASGYVSYKSAEDAETVTYTVEYATIQSVQATLGDDITMKFLLTKDTSKVDVYVSLTMNGKLQTIQLEKPTQKSIKLNGNKVKRYIYQFTGLTPQMLDREFTITAYDKNGILHDSYTYSMLEYCNDLLAQDSVTSETKQVVAELLNYGAAAQKYVGADSSKLQDAIKQSKIALLTDEPQGKVSTTGTEQIVAGATVNFSNVNKIVFAITPENYAKLDSYTIKINDIAVEKSAWVLSGDYYMWYSDGIKATEFGKPCKLVVTNGSKTVQTIEISVNAYCSAVYKMSGVPEALQNLVKATYNYGAAAKTYAESSK